MKRFLNLLVFALLTETIISQNVCINFSVHYETMFSEFLDTIAEVPFLDITYKNNTDQDVFIKGVCDLQSNYPKFGIGSLSHVPCDVYISPDYYEIMAFRHPDYDEDFVVEINDTWTVLDSTQLVEDELCLCPINDNLYYMYEWKELDDIRKTGMPHPEHMMRLPKGLNLVFLKAGTSYVSSYNLDALCINKGSYLFMVSSSYSANSITESCYNMADGRFVSAKLSLPDEIQQYHRYDGEIHKGTYLLKMK